MQQAKRCETMWNSVTCHERWATIWNDLAQFETSW